MNAILARVLWDAQTLTLLVHAFLPFPPLLRLSDWCLKQGNAFDVARERAQHSKDYR